MDRPDDDRVPVHPECEPIAFLLGTWRGEGRGEYPTIEPFRYGEEVRFSHVGKPFLVYAQRTWRLPGEERLHGEVGYWRPKPGGRIELLLAHSSGIAEVAEGTIDGRAIAVASTSIGVAPTAEETTTLERRFEVDGDVLRYELRMAAVGQPLGRHLVAELRRA
jgi:THAP4-like, heme-binding beta-barrel domain